MKNDSEKTVIFEEIKAMIKGAGEENRQSVSLVEIKDGRVICNSLMVAEKFDKNHKDVLRSIQNIECSKDFTERNFALSEYKDSTGRRLPLYEMTRDGFTFLAMGFTGSEAARWKSKKEPCKREQALFIFVICLVILDRLNKLCKLIIYFC